MFSTSVRFGSIWFAIVAGNIRPVASNQLYNGPITGGNDGLTSVSSSLRQHFMILLFALLAIILTEIVPFTVKFNKS